MINLYKMLCTWTGSVFNQDEQLTEQLKDSVRFAIALPFVNCQTFDWPSMHLDTASFAIERLSLSLSLSNYLFLYYGHMSEPDVILNWPDNIPFAISRTYYKKE